MWPHITEYCRIRRVQELVTISLRCLVLPLSQLMTHTLLSKSINEDAKQIPAGWQRFVRWVWISAWPVSSLGSSVHCGCRGWFFHCAVLLQEPFMAVWLFQWGKACEYPSPLAPFYGPWHTSPWTKLGENVVGSVLLFNIQQFPNVSYHQNELVEDTAHSSSCSGYFWKCFPSCFILLIVVQLWYLKSWRDICKMVSS